MAELHHDATLTPGKLELLEAWMGAQRWYAAKGRRPRLRRVGRWRLDDPAGEVGIETLVVADDGGPEPVVYQVPLTYHAEPLAGADHALVGVAEHSVLGRRWVYDAPHDPVYATQLLELVQGRARARSGSRSDTDDDSVHGVPQRSWSAAVRARTSRVLSGEQSNTSIVVDTDIDTDAVDGTNRPVIVKVFRMLSPGDNPDVVLQGALVDAGSTRVPAVVGAVTGSWRHPGSDGDLPSSGHLAVAQEFLPGVEDAWLVAMRAVEDGRDLSGPARTLGEATAEVHGTLADALGTSVTTPAQADAVVAGMRGRLDAAVDAEPALEHVRDAVETVLESARTASWPALQRIHGDYHLGQVLHSAERGWVLVDFEGEPLRPLSERSRPDQWIRDVAGMLHSLDYVGGRWEQLHGGSARSSVAAARASFLDGYAARSGEDLREHRALLAAFELDKALYQLVYEARNRPAWLDVSRGAVRRLIAARSADPTTAGGPS
ncbi:MAG: maltokinase N-terminal cap-like domain-containing protein [Dermatophilaceae bacterium]